MPGANLPGSTPRSSTISSRSSGFSQRHSGWSALSERVLAHLEHGELMDLVQTSYGDYQLYVSGI